jgi:hypothetical protein
VVSPARRQHAPRPSPKVARAAVAALPAKKHCNCKNSRCLKLYCECFASGRYCDGCNCVNCCNNKESEQVRQAAVEAILERNPNAFRPKIQVLSVCKSLVTGLVQGSRKLALDTATQVSCS